MSIEELLLELKKSVEESTKKTNRSIEELRADIYEMKCKMNTENSRLTTINETLNEMSKANLDSATLIEEIAYYMLEEEDYEQINSKEQGTILSIVTSGEEKYVN